MGYLAKKEVAKECGIPKSEVKRIFRELVDSGLIYHPQGSKYWLTPKGLKKCLPGVAKTYRYE